jgi:L-fuconolactonase
VTGVILDTHLHYWEADTPERPHDPQGANIGPPVPVEDLLVTTAAAGVERVIQVTPSCMGYDNRYALEGAARFPERIHGVFGRLDPAAPDIEQQLDEWHANPLTLGIRLTLFPGGREWDANPVWEPFWRGCAERGIPVAVYAPLQVSGLAGVAAAHPTLTLLVDHCALSHDPASLDQFDQVLDLERLPNVYLKVSYFPEATGEEYPFPRGQRMMREVYERFGADRLMWGSNYPPVLTVCSYEDALRFITEACDFLEPEHRAKILGGTARRVLGIG